MSTIATTTSGRIARTEVVVISTTNAKRNGRTGPLLIAAIRHSSHAQCTGRRACIPPRSATKTPRTTNIKFKTKNVNTRCITTMRTIQVTMTSHALAPIHRSQVRTRRQPPTRAKKNHEDENYHLHIEKKEAGSHVPHKSDHRQHGAMVQSSQKGKEGETPPTLLDNDLDFTDTILMGLNSIDADLNRPDDGTNPFDFNM
jgi:hypothetical protein